MWLSPNDHTYGHGNSFFAGSGAPEPDDTDSPWSGRRPFVWAAMSGDDGRLTIESVPTERTTIRKAATRLPTSKWQTLSLQGVAEVHFRPGETTEVTLTREEPKP